MKDVVKDMCTRLLHILAQLLGWHSTETNSPACWQHDPPSVVLRVKKVTPTFCHAKRGP